ncbi:MAG: hypothetical protein PUB67_04715 [Clostridiales bacterium]|nr:hypothetical protein [Clostridiales bacterium]
MAGKKDELEQFMDDNIVYCNGRARRKDDSLLWKIFRWWPLYVYILFCSLILVFIATGDEKLPYEAYYKEGTKYVVIGDVSYRTLSVDDEDEYIGSFVSTKLQAVKNEKIARIKSYLLYVSSYYSVVGCENLDYVIDGKYNVYVRAELLDEKKAYFDNKENITSYKMTSKNKDHQSMNPLSEEFVEMLDNLSGTEIVIKELYIIENYENRREIYGFYSDGIFSRACYELFMYKDDIYLTTKVLDKKKNNGESVLRGIRLPDEYQDYIKKIWD